MAFFVLAKEDCFAPEENFEPNSAGMKSSRTRRVRHKSLEENHSAWIKQRLLIGHTTYSEETPKKILKQDILTEVGALCKVSPSKFVLVFGSKTPKEKLAGIEIQCRFSNSEVHLNFRKRVGPLRNGNEPILVTIFLPELISDQAVRLAFSNFREVVSVFLAMCLKADMYLTEKLETVKGMLKSSPRQEIQ